MTLLWSDVLPLLLILPLLAGVRYWMLRRRRRAGVRFSSLSLVREAMPRSSALRRHLPFTLFLFGLVNGGVTIRAVEEGQWALPAALIAGRPLGVLVVVLLAGALGVHVPRRLGWREFLVIGLASGIGFTLALFFAGSVFPPGQLSSETKMGALLSLAAAPFAWWAARLLRVGRFSS